eukprot:TRINITY_DN33044_c0_g1_i1.p1 TRINITY_DN33044_c0_g1~~TRINITY_DN33044_c0_g1_i1.p1  ORF type:complete len:167 (-),score=26.04 TRINITY_DN33044_c0_g1_i1:45-479(-)
MANLLASIDGRLANSPGSKGGEKPVIDVEAATDSSRTFTFTHKQAVSFNSLEKTSSQPAVEVRDLYQRPSLLASIDGRLADSPGSRGGEKPVTDVEAAKDSSREFTRKQAVSFKSLETTSSQPTVEVGDLYRRASLYGRRSTVG